jgi:hypothetical protein
MMREIFVTRILRMPSQFPVIDEASFVASEATLTASQNHQRSRKGTRVMLTKTKIALAAVLLAGSATLATADGYDPNLANRYPAYADPIYPAQSYAGRVVQAPHGALQSAPVRLQNGNRYSPATNPPVDEINENDWYRTNAHDKASSPFAGGG